MHHELTLPEREAAHNLINLRIYPRFRLGLGQTETLHHGDAMVRIERTGNMLKTCMQALTYRYEITGAGYEFVLLAIYNDARSATALVTAQSISPDPAETDGEFLRWLSGLIDQKRAPSTCIFDALFEDLP